MKNIKVRVGEGRGVGGVLRFAWNKTLGPDILWNSVVWFYLAFAGRISILAVAKGSVLVQSCCVNRRCD